MFQRLFAKTASISQSENVKTVDPADRIYAVGDIHGCSALLNGMLEAIGDDISSQTTARRNRIVFLGDYVDRGDNSKEVLDSLADIFSIRDKLEHQTGVRIDFLAGNHEAALLDFLDDPVLGKSWLEWGGRQTLASYGILPNSGALGTEDLHVLRDQLYDRMGSHLPFLKGLSKTIVSGDVVFVHAGLDPNSSPSEQPDSAALWGLIPAGRQSGLPGYRMVHGHYAKYEPVTIRDRICVDTGAYYSGRLTAVRLDEGEAFLHVDAGNLLD